MASGWGPPSGPGASRPGPPAPPARSAGPGDEPTTSSDRPPRPDIGAPGKITEQIATELTTCDLIIADITSNNANVAWELGYGYALKKPCVILRQAKDVAAAPFDIYDHRRVEYSQPPTTAERGRLRQLVGGAIRQARGA